jgi:hypothetical protein
MKKIILPAFCFLLTEWAAAQWSIDPAVNNPICTAADWQALPAIAGDGSGGAIIAWNDWRGGSSIVYAQRIDSDGVLRWQTNGVPVCSVSGSTDGPVIAADGKGGAVIAWYDYRSGSYSDIYAQRINADGAVQWDPAGVAVCTAPGNQSNPQIISDERGGAIICWCDNRSLQAGIHAQRVDSAGVVQWMTDGIDLCSEPNFETYPAMTGDGNKGAIVTWLALYGHCEVYSQRIDSGGTILWPMEGVLIFSGTCITYEPHPKIISDGAGGAVITWNDTYAGSSDVYAQRINSNGIILWQSNGVTVCGNEYDQIYPDLVSDDEGGAIISWLDDWYPDTGIFAQRVDLNGNLLWAPGGAPVYLTEEHLEPPVVCSDGAGGAIVSITNEWVYTPDGNIYAQRIDPDGELRWQAAGAAVCNAPEDQLCVKTLSDGRGGAVFVWEDRRNGGIGYDDIYCARIDSNGNPGGSIPVELLSFAGTGMKYTVLLSWSTAAETNNYGFEIIRKAPDKSAWEKAGFVEGHGTTINIHHYNYKDIIDKPGKYRYKLRQIDLDGTYEYSEVIEVEIPYEIEFSLDQNYPNPFNPATTINYGVPDKGLVTLKVYDVLGKEAAILVNEDEDPGKYSINFDASNLASGIYVYQLRVNGFTASKKMNVVK